ncbi:Gfo/Idh/MocA family oxidoreductase [Brachybacterium sp. Marseille-Q2903]|uniref:Gfo/Idh/MocA family oxidoreductase n=1 Tax=Brachybacterium epidermidis TaxID=2781983 RepID=A0ABR9W3A7_9MICO|nr:Gfo/Idh/MocA family oxidoreductase [Brachybacterium epidermidis]MBE9404892.1 Gfo/Idh/MocA family oxidoreductase [Brachybacterium epidermidis]
MTTPTGPVGVGIIGAGVIAAQYLTQLATFPDVEVRAIGDLRAEASAARAEEYGIPHHGGVETVLDDPDVEIVINLTIPAAHHAVSSSILEAGKHVWSEKPLTTNREDAAALLRQASETGLRVGCAPDTVLGAGVQTALRTLASGVVGEPRSAVARFRSPGPESWHPNPDFLFQAGAGPLYDIGPYYLTALVMAYGPVSSVSAVGSRASETRTIGSGPRAGESFEVEVPTHVNGVLRFASGTTGSVEFSFDDPIGRPPVLELTGSTGTIALPDPNVFEGPTLVAQRGDEDWTEHEATGAVTGRGLGVLEMARAIRAGRPHRLTGELADHVLDIMISLDEATGTTSGVDLASTVSAPALLDEDFDPLAATL